MGKVERRKGVRVGWAPQRPAQYGRLSARENLELFARLEGEHDPRAAAEALLEAFELPGAASPSANLSVGNRQRLNLAISLLGDPDVLLLDEPTAALDPDQRRRLWERAGRAASARRGGRLRDAERRGGRAHREPRRRAARGPPRLRRDGRRVRPGPRRESVGVNRIALLLRKDVLVLRRSPLLLGILLAYPLAIALLIGLVASYGSSKPRVAFVDEDNLPATVVLGGKRFDVGHTIDEASKKVKLVRLSPEEAKRQLDDGRVVAVVTVPPGFVSTLRGMVRSPQLELQLSTGTISSRVEQQVQALVYSLNRQLQSAYIASNLRYVTLILHGGDGSFLGAPITVLGIEKAQRLLREMPQTPRTAQLLDFLHDARLALANTNDALSSTAHPIELVRAPARGRTWALSAEVQAYALALTITFLALLLAAGSLAAERDENVVGRLARGLVGLGQLVWSKVALAAAVALAARARDRARLRADHRDRRRHRRRAVAAAAAARGRARARGRLGRRARRAARRAGAGGALGLARRGAGGDADRLPRADPGRGRAAGGLAQRRAAVRRTRCASSARRSTTSAPGERCCARACGSSRSARSSAGSPGWERVDCWCELVPGHAPAPAPPQRPPARARARDAARPRRLRPAALRRPGHRAEPGAAGARPLLGRRPRRRGRGGGAARRARGAAVRDPGREGRGGLRRLGRRRRHPARAAGAPRGEPGPRAADRRLPLRVHLARPLRRARGRRGRQRRDARAARAHGRLATPPPAPTRSARAT